MKNSPEFVLTSKTRVEGKLVGSTAGGSAMFYLLILWFMFAVFHWDMEEKWYHYTTAGFFDELPRMSEETKKQEQLKEVVSFQPALYSILYEHWHYFAFGIPFLVFLVGGFLSFYRSVTITILGLYHSFFASLTMCLVLLAILAIVISNTHFIIRPL